MAVVFDLVTGLILFPLRVLRPRRGAPAPKKILIIRLDALGDVMLTRLAIHSLRCHFPEARIDLLVSEEYAPLLRKDAAVNRVLPFKHSWFRSPINLKALQEAFSWSHELRKERYDVGIDFRGDLRNILLLTLAGIPTKLAYGQTGGKFLLTFCADDSKKQHRVLIHQNLLGYFGIKNFPSRAGFNISQADKHRFMESFDEPLEGYEQPRIVIHPGAAYPSKRWPAEKFKQLIEKILRENVGTLFLIGTQEEKELFPVASLPGKLLDLRGRTHLEDLPVLLEQCRLFIGNDSGPAHLAAAHDLELIILFSGTNDAEIWRPWSDRLSLVRHLVSCSPCDARVCPLGHHDCMQKISVEEVFQKIQAVLAAQKVNVA